MLINRSHAFVVWLVDQAIEKALLHILLRTSVTKGLDTDLTTSYKLPRVA